MTDAHAAVRRLTGTGIDCFDSPEPSECWQKAMAHVNYKGDADAFKAAARNVGIMCHEIRGARNGARALYRMYVPATGLDGYSGRI